MQQNILQSVKGLVAPFVLFSCISNLAILVSPIYMMQILDRVVPSGNMGTLYLLLSVALGVLALQAVVEYFRDISLKGLSIWTEKNAMEQALQLEGQERQNAIDDLSTLKGFLRSTHVVNAINIPWIPLFLFALALINPLFLLLVALVIGINHALKFGVAWHIEKTQKTLAHLNRQEINCLKDACDPDLRAGMPAVSENLVTQYFANQNARQIEEKDIFGPNAMEMAGTNAMRMASQILALSLGAALVVSGDLTAGGMIGASIITSKTIQTIDSSVAGFPSFREAYNAFRNLSSKSAQDDAAQPDLPDFSGSLNCNEIIFPRGGGAPPRLDRISFMLEPGQALAIIGDSGSGKTTLLHALCGIEPSPIGSVFLDQSDIRTLNVKTIARSIGYLPQQARLTKGTLAQNISCFAQSPNDDDIISASRIAGVHGLISSLPNSYATDIGEEGYLLSAGQKQRVALARAIFARPKYLFLDEPNALLDAQGERQLCDTLAQLKRQGTTIIMVLHRSGVMGIADKVMHLDRGRIKDFGSRAEVLGRMSTNKHKIDLIMVPAAVQDLSDWIASHFQRHTDKEFAQKAILAGTELFNSARLSGEADKKREASVTLKFHSETHCEITLLEEASSLAADKMKMIQSLIVHPEVDMLNLSEDEISLAVLAQISDEFSVKNTNGSAVYRTLLSAEDNSSRSQVTH